MKTINSYHGCSLCGSSELDRVTTNISFGVDILKCSNCKLVQSEYISDKALHDYYSEYYRGTLTQTDITELRALSHQQAVSQIDYLSTILPDAHFDNVLEIGSGIGELAKELARTHGNVHVTEADPQYVALLNKEGRLNHIESDELNEEKYSQFFDFLVLSHVLEHLSNPVEWLDHLSRILKRNGYMFIELPNECDMLISNNFQGKGHLYFYTIGTFNALITRQGSFEIVEIRTCNRTIEDYTASNFTLADDFNLKYSANGTTIRALLVNKTPTAFSSDTTRLSGSHQRLLDEYSRRIVHLHQENLNLKRHMTSLQNKCQSAIKEARQIVMNTVASSGSRPPNET